MPPHSPRPFLRRLTAATAIGVIAIATAGAAPAGAHAETLPSDLDPGEVRDVVVRSISERQDHPNVAMDVIVPPAFGVEACTAPSGWGCTIDRATHRPHTLVTYRADGPTDENDFDFTVRLRAPETDGAWLLPVVQTHDDGWTEPWLYAQEPYVAPVLEVGAGGPLQNQPSSAGAACVGPDRQPTSYESHDGSAGDRAPCPDDAPAPATTTAPASGTGAPAPSPGTQPQPNGEPAPGSPGPSDDAAPGDTGSETTTTELGADGAPTSTTTEAASEETASDRDDDEGDEDADESTVDESAGAVVIDEGDDGSSMGVLVALLGALGAAVVALVVWRRRREATAPGVTQ